MKSIIDFSKNHNVYIYGAGIVGKRCRSFLADNGIISNGFIVTEKPQSEVSDEGLIAVDGIRELKDIGVIIAGNYGNSIAMHDELVKRGIVDYMFFDESIEARIEGLISAITSSDDSHIAVLGDGAILKSVIDRIQGSGKLYLVSDDLYKDCIYGLSVHSFDDAVKDGIKKIIIAEGPDGTAGLFVRFFDRARDNEISLFDASGKELCTESYEDPKLETKEKSDKWALVIDSDIPRYDMNAGARLSYYYMLCLKKMGYSVWLLPLNTKSNEYKSQYEDAGINVVADIQYGELWIYANGRHFDLVFLQRAECAEIFGDYIAKYCHDAKVIFHPADLHFVRLERQYAITGNESLKEEAKRFKDIECKAIENSDFVYVVGSAEKKIVEDMFPFKAVRDIPIYLYDENAIPDRKPAGERKDLIFVGGFAHNPNIDAVEWFAGEILPKIQEAYPEIICHVVGSNVPPKLLTLANDHLIFEGFVSDEKLKELYLECRISVAPLRFGAGIKGKIIEAAYYGLPVVTTSIGAEGIHDKDKFITVADDAEGFADAVIRIYNDPDLIDRVSEQTKEVITDNYTERIAEDILRNDLEGLL